MPFTFGRPVYVVACGSAADLSGDLLAVFRTRTSARRWATRYQRRNAAYLAKAHESPLIFAAAFCPRRIITEPAS